ncbi:MAG: selenide, water dikinase SelD [Actinobacteria bacterium]|nr:selenide, water dikinase SelD [Actinomycetota bacterium]
MGPEDLEKVLRLLPPGEVREEILVGLDTPDDAAVFLLDGETALVHTVDFFTPIVDDPYLFGQIAAANALSDIYAMGGVPLSAMNIVCFPCSLGMDVLAAVLRGGLDKVREAGAALVGGHTVEDEEPKYGLAVTGKVHPRRILTSRGAAPGDVLVLTKPLGTGILATALKGDFLCEEDMEDALRGMAELNARASAAALAAGARACTDVTGFGLLGHLLNMLPEEGLSCEVSVSSLPVYARVREMADMGMVPAGSHRNRDFLQGKVEFAAGVDVVDRDILCDPQTSGGMLIALPPENLPEFAARMGEEGSWRRVGEFVSGGACPVRVSP